MSIKPTNIVQWALNDALMTIKPFKANKTIPEEQYVQNGSLDGVIGVNHFNFMINTLGLWSAFMNDMVVATNGNGVGLTKEGHFSFIFAFDSSNINNYVLGFANKNGTLAADINTLLSNGISFDTPLANGDIVINGGASSNIRAFSLNFKL